ncbi:MAG: DUF2298 domain-containing protein [Caldilineaceae bacterium]
MNSHPDERSTTCNYAASIALPTSWDQFWDPQQSPLNPLWDIQAQRPRSYTYGHFPLYLGVAMGELFHKLAPTASTLGAPDWMVQRLDRANTPCDGVAIPGRFTIALLDTITILLLFLLGRRIYGAWAGLVAAAFYAFTAQAIQLSHFFAMDPASTTFTVLAVFGAIKMVQERTLTAALMAGIGAGLAVSSKFSALPILAAPVVAGILVWFDHTQVRITNHESQDSDAESEFRNSSSRDQLRALLYVPLALLVAVAVFAVTSPYAILDAKNFLQATLVEQGRMVRGIADMPFTRQYRNTTPYLYFIQQQLEWGMGYPLGIVASLGALVAIVQLLIAGVKFLLLLITGNPRWRLSKLDMGMLIVWSWVLPYFGLTGAFLAKFNRYMSPVLPFWVLWGAGFVRSLWNLGKKDRRTGGQEDKERQEFGFQSSPLLVFLSKGLATILAVVGLAGGLFWGAAYVNGVYRQPHPWITAGQWMAKNIPAGSTILWEQWDDRLPFVGGWNDPDVIMAQNQWNFTDWGPYEEDTPEKYQIMKQKLMQSDYVIYSSKRIWASVDNLPERYPMTNLYYRSMFDGSLGFDLIEAPETYPQLFGFKFPDKGADESWSLYDHPQPLIFKKVRQLSEAEFDAKFANSWVGAQAWYRGEDSPLSPFLNVLGLGNAPESEGSGLINRLVQVAMGGDAPPEPTVPLEERPSLLLDKPLNQLPIVDNYRWNQTASENTWMAVAWWWLIVSLVGWVAWPLAFYLFAPLRDRGYLLSRAFGWLITGWLLWMLASQGILLNTVRNAWLMVALLAVVALIAAILQRNALLDFIGKSGWLLLASEGIFAAAYLFFVLIRMGNPDLWQPWLGGEKFMEFAFLNGILRSPTFPPLDPHFAGGIINYYYFGLYLVAYQIKLTGIYAEVAFNLAIPTLFALTIANTFSVAFSALQPSTIASTGRLQQLAKAGLAPLFVALIGNLDGAGLLLRNLAQLGQSQFQSDIPGLQTTVQAISGLRTVLTTDAVLPRYDFWAPSRVIPATINEFPYWSFLFADLHPHLIGIPMAGLFIALMLTLLRLRTGDGASSYDTWGRRITLLGLFALLLGTLASINLWELPTYLGLGILVFVVAQFRWRLSINWLLTLVVAIVYASGAYLLYLPFFRSYKNIGASGVGYVHTPDDTATWLLIWGFLGFIVVSWLFYEATRKARPLGVHKSAASSQWSVIHSDEVRDEEAVQAEEASNATPELGEVEAPVPVLISEAALSTEDSLSDGALLHTNGTPASEEAMAAPSDDPDVDEVLYSISHPVVEESTLVIEAEAASEVVAPPLPAEVQPVEAAAQLPEAESQPLEAEPVVESEATVAPEFVPQPDIVEERSAQPAPATPKALLQRFHLSGIERWLSLAGCKFDRLPRVIYLQQLLVEQPTVGYLLNQLMIPLLLILAALCWWWGRTVLALCIGPIGLAWVLLWRRGRNADEGSALGLVLAITGLAILGGTQLVYLKDFLGGGDWYRMNTLFKFFSQVWVLWGVAAGIALPRIWDNYIAPLANAPGTEATSRIPRPSILPRSVWAIVFTLLFIGSLVFPFLGTPDRLDQRFPGWRPAFGTLNGLDYMNEGMFTWRGRDDSVGQEFPTELQTELHYDREAIQWLLDNVRGNPVILESDEIDYYRAAGTRVATMTGFSSLVGQHKGEQYYGEMVGQRSSELQSLWQSPDLHQTQQLLDQLDVSLIYMGQLERYEDAPGVAKFEQMASSGQLTIIYQNEKVTILAVPGHLTKTEQGIYIPAATPAPAVGMKTD